ncbi:flagellar filament capping protein FliD [Cohnella silvisoli]|uniref:Flagellar hook-associated protein 2 n=2 Tax=Cohnella silvisoli TaxID=2873699 RepID=A0ABV1KR89_9BACL
MDIDTMVKNLMKANRAPLNKLNASKTVLEWQRDAYRSVNTKVLEFRNQVFNMKLDSNFSNKKAISSNDSSISVSGTATAAEGIYQIEVIGLAEGAKLNSTGPIGAKAKQGLSTKLSDIGSFSGLTTLTVAGEKGTTTIEVKGADTLDSLVKSINDKSGATGVKLNYDANLDHLFFTSSNTGLAAKVSLQSQDSGLLQNVLNLGNPGAVVPGSLLTGATTFADRENAVINSSLTADQTISVSYGGAVSEFTISKTTTLGTLIKQINSSEVGKKGMSAIIDSTNHLAFTNPTDQTDPDPTKKIVITDITADSTDALIKLGIHDAGGLDSLVVTSRDYFQVSDAGLDASIKFNGVLGTYSTNSFNINGLDFTAKAVGGMQTITVTQDTDAVYDKIKTFVDKYNELIDSVNKTLDEKKYRDFPPLTDEQKADMKEDDIKKWNEKAQSGMLRSDQMISSALAGFRTSISSVITGLPSGDLKQLSQLGIVTGSYAEKGKLYIESPTQLKKMIAEKPDEVAALFTAKDSDPSSNTADGIATRLVEQADALMAKIKKKAGTISSVDTTFTIGKQTRDYDKRIYDMGVRLDALETKYYNQFTAMEKYINQMNTQSAYLAQQFGGGK